MDGNVTDDPPAPPAASVSLKGQVVHLRPKSKKLLFFDIRFATCDATFSTNGLPLSHPEDTSRSCKFSVICKSWEVVSEVMSRARCEMNVGDIVSLEGWLEDSKPPLLHYKVEEMEVLDIKGKAEMACKFWTNTGNCSAGSTCRHKHYTGDDLKEVRAYWIEQRQTNRRLQHINPTDPAHPHDKASAGLRASIFIQWLLQNYGSTYLSSGTGVLDIGGGRGIISFELTSKLHVPCTLIDPRHDTDREDGIRPNKLQRQWMRQQKKNAVNPSTIPQASHIRSLFNTSFVTNHETLVSNSSIFIGMHADQATEPIIDQALACSKPFAVLPCCVFPRENPHRRLKGGGDVVLYEEFVQYLVEKDGRIRRGYLPFEGRNLVLYLTREDVGRGS
ncbi:hypothetical protein HDV00_011455 [Rhizophlyctis rosea]|nr:hypothetical protein HDV00_011455 [Rhizophlyctis rosea]